MQLARFTVALKAAQIAPPPTWPPADDSLRLAVKVQLWMVAEAPSW